MFKKIFSSRPKAVRSTIGFRARTVMRFPGAEHSQETCFTEHYTLTEVNGQTMMFLASANARFVVDRAAKTLKPVPPLPAQHVAAIQQLRNLVGDVSYVPDEGMVEMGGRSCRRLVLEVDVPQLVMSGEAFATRVPGLETTALRLERVLDASVQPFRLGLADDELVVRSTTRLLAAGTGQNQEVELVSLQEETALEEMDAMAAYKIID